MTIFDLVQSKEIAAYWDALADDRMPYVGEELFPANKKRGLSLSWIKGAKGLPVALKPSAFDAYAVPRPRIGFDKLTTDMPYFKESMYIDEELRQELNMVLETGNSAYVNSVLENVFDDTANLLEGARVSRERMRMMALTTGTVAMAANGQSFLYDYGMPLNHSVTATVSWANVNAADPFEEIRALQEAIQDDTGVMPTRAITTGRVWRQLRDNLKLKLAIYPITGGVGNVTDNQLKGFLLDELGLRVVVNDKRYIDEGGVTRAYVPADTFVIFPEGSLGTTWFGTTPAESDLMSGSAANVSITDLGVAVVTRKLIDPVNVDTIVSQICLPSFESADYVGIIDTVAAGAGATNVTFTALQDGGSAGTANTTSIDFTFSVDVVGLKADHISIAPGTGAATKGVLTGSGKNWNLTVTNPAEGTVLITIAGVPGYAMPIQAATVDVYAS